MNSAGCMPATTATGQGSLRAWYLPMMMRPCLPGDIITVATAGPWLWTR